MLFAMPSFITEIPVRFGEIDHGGIVYYPRISHYLHIAFEEFFAAGVGQPYPHVFDERRLGFPTVHSDIDYRIPLAYGDRLQVEAVVTRLGRSSLEMRYRIRKNAGVEICTEATITTCCIHMESFRPTPIPDDLRAVFARFIAEDDGEGAA